MTETHDPGFSPVRSNDQRVPAAWALLVAALASGLVALFLEDSLTPVPGYGLIGLSFICGAAAAVLGSRWLRGTGRTGATSEERWAAVLVACGGLAVCLAWVALALWITYLILYVAD